MRYWAPILALLLAAAPSTLHAEPAAPSSRPGASSQPKGPVEMTEGVKEPLSEAEQERPRKAGEIRTSGKRRRVSRALVGFELAPGVAIPFGNYLDFGSGDNTYAMENGVGFGLAVSLTLDAFEFRYTYTALSTGRIKGRLPDGVYTDLQQLDTLLGGTLGVQQDLDQEASSALLFHNVTFGYRMNLDLMEGWRIAVPFGFGIVVATPPEFGLFHYNLYGFGGHIGLRSEWMIGGMLALGLDARFSIYLTEADPNLGAAGYAATKNVFDNVVGWLPMLTLSATARLYY